LAECDREIAQSARDDEAARRLQAVSGVGIITADAVCASVGMHVTSKTAGSSPPGWG